MSDLPLTADSSLSAVIAEFMSTASSAAQRREMRAALSHVDAELGTKPLRAVRTRHVTALLDDLHDAGLSERRETAIVDALHALYAFAIARGLVGADPLPGPAAATPAPTPTPIPAPPSLPTPTLTMLALGARVTIWTTWTITIVFAALLVALVIELS